MILTNADTSAMIIGVEVLPSVTRVWEEHICLSKVAESRSCIKDEPRSRQVTAPHPLNTFLHQSLFPLDITPYLLNDETFTHKSRKAKGDSESHRPVPLRSSQPVRLCQSERV